MLERHKRCQFKNTVKNPKQAQLWKCAANEKNMAQNAKTNTVTANMLQIQKRKTKSKRTNSENKRYRKTLHMQYWMCSTPPRGRRAKWNSKEVT